MYFLARFLVSGLVSFAVLFPAASHSATLYAVRGSSANYRLISIDTNTLAVADIGALGVDFRYGGFAYDPNAAVLYGITGEGFPVGLHSIDIGTGVASPIGPAGIRKPFGLAFDSTNDTLFGTTQRLGGGDLYTIDTTTGTQSLVGSFGVGIDGLAYDSKNDRLVGMNAGAGDLYEIDRVNGTLSLLFDGAFVNSNGLAYDSVQNLFWDIDTEGNLYSYDPANAFARTTRLTGLGAGTSALAFVVPEPVPLMGPLAMTIFGGLLGFLGFRRLPL